MNRPARPRIPTPDGIPFVGLTGGMGAGKSTALRALNRLGCAVLSADEVVHQIQAEPEVVGEMVAKFGPSVATEGVLDRQALATAVFSDPAGRQWMEELIWPRVGQRIQEWQSGLGASTPKPLLAVVEVPLLFESGMETVFDTTICVVTDEDVRAQRAASRGHAAVDERAARQFSQADKASRAEWTVLNDGSEVELESKLSEVVAGITA
ncbi:MAG: dephospho-CoA kinase [Actinobacteria bacterium]|nr:dephospho-CoA kinase [Actinomycetota bacterium]